MGVEHSEDSLRNIPLATLVSALDWIIERLSEFSLIDRFDLSDPSLKDQLPQLKPISELALTIAILRRCGIWDDKLGKISFWIWSQTDSGRILLKLLLARNDLLPCCSLFGPLYELGHRSDNLESTLKLLARSDMARVLPQTPWGSLAVRRNLNWLGLANRPDSQDSALYVNALAEPWVMSSDIAYAITHEVFYLTDFGRETLDDSEVKDYLAIWLPYWARIFWSQQDYDVSGEFAMAYRCLGLRDASVTDLLLPILEAQTSTGYVPGPKGAGNYLHRIGDSLSRREFLAHYHTTLVAIMACAMHTAECPSP